MPIETGRRVYYGLYGPTVGDCVRSVASLYLDHNVSARLARLLRNAGHEVVTDREVSFARRVDGAGWEPYR